MAATLGEGEEKIVILVTGNHADTESGATVQCLPKSKSKKHTIWSVEELRDDDADGNQRCPKKSTLILARRYT